LNEESRISQSQSMHGIRNGNVGKHYISRKSVINWSSYAVSRWRHCVHAAVCTVCRVSLYLFDWLPVRFQAHITLIVSIRVPSVINVHQVFFLTAAFSLFAYIWLVVILVANTPNVVDVWEAVLTFLFFPILVILAYTTDKGCFRSGPREDGKPAAGEEQALKTVEEGGENNAYCKSLLTDYFFILNVVLPHVNRRDEAECSRLVDVREALADGLLRRVMNAVLVDCMA
jgi:hypothetical protein